MDLSPYNGSANKRNIYIQYESLKSILIMTLAQFIFRRHVFSNRDPYNKNLFVENIKNTYDNIIIMILNEQFTKFQIHILNLETITKLVRT